MLWPLHAANGATRRHTAAAARAPAQTPLPPSLATPLPAPTWSLPPRVPPARGGRTPHQLPSGSPDASSPRGHSVTVHCSAPQHEHGTSLQAAAPYPARGRCICQPSALAPPFGRPPCSRLGQHSWPHCSWPCALSDRSWAAPRYALARGACRGAASQAHLVGLRGRRWALDRPSYAANF